jgi:integrase
MEHGWGFSSWVGEVGVRLFWLNFTSHDLKHEAISRFIERGLTIPEAASISGHKAQLMLLRYAHPDLSCIKKKVMSF